MNQKSFALNGPITIMVLLTLATVILYRETVTSLLRLWTDSDNSNYSHGLLLLATCLFLCYKRSKEATEQIGLEPNMVGFSLLLVTSLAWFVAGQKHWQILQQMTLVLLPLFMLLAISGPRTTRLFCFPILLMVFAVPVWDSLTPLLQTLTAHGVTMLLNTTGITSVLEGKLILIPAGTFDVAPSCSGLRQFVVATMIAGIYAYVRRLRWQSASLLASMAIVLSIVANIVRVYIVVVAGQLTAMESSLVTNHSNLGKALFAIWIIPFILLANRFVQAPRATPELVARNNPRRNVGHSPDANPKTPALQKALIVVAAIAVGPLLSYYYHDHGRDASLLPLDPQGQVKTFTRTLANPLFMFARTSCCES